MNRPIIVGGALVATVALLIGATPAASAPDHQSSNNNNSQKLRTAVTVEGIQEHLTAFQSFADAGPGNRISGNTGYEGSVDYVAARAAAAGLDVTVQEFEYDLGVLADWQAPILEVVGGPALVPGIAAAQLGGDFGSMFKSTAYGIDTTAPVWAIDLALDDPTTTTSGCELSDFDGVPEGAIVVVHGAPAGSPRSSSTHKIPAPPRWCSSAHFRARRVPSSSISTGSTSRRWAPPSMPR